MTPAVRHWRTVRGERAGHGELEGGFPPRVPRDGEPGAAGVDPPPRGHPPSDGDAHPGHRGQGRFGDVQDGSLGGDRHPAWQRRQRAHLGDLRERRSLDPARDNERQPARPEVEPGTPEVTLHDAGLSGRRPRLHLVPSAPVHTRPAWPTRCVRAGNDHGNRTGQPQDGVASQGQLAAVTPDGIGLTAPRLVEDGCAGELDKAVARVHATQRQPRPVHGEGGAHLAVADVQRLGPGVPVLRRGHGGRGPAGEAAGPVRARAPGRSPPGRGRRGSRSPRHRPRRPRHRAGRRRATCRRTRRR